MAMDLLSLAKGYLTSEVVDKISSFVGESPSNTQRAVDGAIPAIFGGLLQGASTETGAASLLRTVQQGGFDGSLLNNLGSALSGGAATQNLANSGSGLLSSIFGGNLGSIVNALAGSTGVKSSGISSLLGLAAPIIMNLIGKQIGSQGLNAAGLMNLLAGQRDSVQRAMPSSLGSLMGLGSLAGAAGGAARQAARTAERTAGAAAETAASSKWLWPLLIAGVLALGLWYFLRGGAGEQAVETAQEAATGAAEATAEAAKDVGAAVADAAQKISKITLPGGIDLDLPEGSINYRVAKFLESTEGALPQTFVFDNLNFATGSATITPESQQTVDNLAAILKAYPNAEVRLDGHTDSQGDATANKKLSQDRADAVRTALAALGVDAARITPAGFGQEKPIASNDTEEGRAQNRRTELTIVKR